MSFSCSNLALIFDISTKVKANLYMLFDEHSTSIGRTGCAVEQESTATGLKIRR